MKQLRPAHIAPAPSSCTSLVILFGSIVGTALFFPLLFSVFCCVFRIFYPFFDFVKVHAVQEAYFVGIMFAAGWYFTYIIHSSECLIHSALDLCSVCNVILSWSSLNLQMKLFRYLPSHSSPHTFPVGRYLFRLLFVYSRQYAHLLFCRHSLIIVIMLLVLM